VALLADVATNLTKLLDAAAHGPAFLVPDAI
jgi:hypothetical protein